MCEFYRGMTQELALDQLDDIFSGKEVISSEGNFGNGKESIAENAC